MSGENATDKPKRRRAKATQPAPGLTTIDFAQMPDGWPGEYDEPASAYRGAHAGEPADVALARRARSIFLRLKQNDPRLVERMDQRIEVEAEADQTFREAMEAWGITAAVAQLIQEHGRERIEAMSEDELARALAQMIAGSLELADPLGFLAAIEKALDLPHYPAGRRKAPLTFESGSADAPNNVFMKALVAFAYAHQGTLRRGKDGKVYFQYADEAGSVVVSVPAPSPRPTGGVRPPRLKDFEDPELDILLVIMAKAGGADEHGGIWLTAKELLLERGVEVKRKDGYLAGVRVDALLEVEAQIERLATVEIEIQQALIEVPGSRGRPRRDMVYGVSEKILSVQKHSVHDLYDPSERVPLFFYVKPAEYLRWRGAVGPQLAPIARRVLQYHQHNDRWKKRLGTHFTVHMGFTEGRLACVSKVGRLLDDVGLNFSTRNPQKTWAMLARALNELKADQVIGAYELELPAGQRYGTVEERRPPAELPARGWREQLLESTLRVLPPRGAPGQWERLSGGGQRLLADGPTGLVGENGA